tara:strand:- start:204 stop:851 length:648 start_codon:yes stop_codon:yes gene_type:complete
MNIDAKKMAGYCLIIGPVMALVSFFIQPGGILGIGGSTPEPLDFVAGKNLAVDNSALAIITGILVTMGLLKLLSGIVFYANNVMQNGDGYGLGRVSMPFFMAAVIGWTIANGMNIALAGEIVTDENILGVSFGVNIICSIAFGFGGIILALATSLRNEVNKNLSYLAAIAAAGVFLSNILVAFSPDSGNTIQLINGVCFIVYTVYSMAIGRALIK